LTELRNTEIQIVEASYMEFMTLHGQVWQRHCVMLQSIHHNNLYYTSNYW